MKKIFIALIAAGLLPWAACAQENAAAPVQASEKPAVKVPKAAKAKAPKKMKKAPVQKAAAAAVEDYTPAAAEYGRKTVCPVMGDEVIVNPKTQAVKYKGKVYYFCCSACPKKFHANPEKYAK
ncbi:MAG: YHS domain-containing protein [Elusimicrobiota bacterium]